MYQFISKSSTIFDFTDDVGMIKKIIGSHTKEDYVTNASLAAKVCGMIDYAEYTKNTELKARLEELFSDELDSFFNE